MKIIIKIISSFPLFLLHFIGGFLGALSFFLRSRSRKRSLEFANLAQIKNPYFNVLRSYADFGKTIFEAAWLWINPPQKTLAKIIDETSPEIFAEIKNHAQEKKPLLFLGCHLGASEVAIIYLKKHFESAILYQNQKNPWLLALREQTHPKHEINLFTMDVAGVRQLFKYLLQGGAIGISADQTPYEGSGIWLPFFGRNANTMTLAPKIALQKNVKTVFVLHLRSTNGFRIKLIPLNEVPQTIEECGIYFNSIFEKHIKEYPHQYRWAYDRYRVRTK